MSASAPAWEVGTLSGVSDPLPLLLRPPEQGRGGGRSPSGFLHQVEHHRRWIQSSLLERGALLFRGFLAGEAEELEAFLEAAALRPMEYVRGNVRRERVRNRIFTSTEAPSYLPIPLHHEMAYSSSFPLQIAFLCSVPPRRGGETPIADTGDLLAELPEELRRRFEEHGVIYVQVVPERRLLPWRKTWREMFQVTDRAQAEALCADRNIETRWHRDGGLELRSRLPAIVDHPLTGEPLWFNQVHIYHPSFAPELERMGQALPGLGVSILERLVGERRALRFFRHGVELGDGAPVPVQEVETIRQHLWSRAVRFPWQRGDLLLLDNLRVAHGRMPFRGPRRILAALIEAPEAAPRSAVPRAPAPVPAP